MWTPWVSWGLAALAAAAALLTLYVAVRRGRALAALGVSALLVGAVGWGGVEVGRRYIQAALDDNTSGNLRRIADVTRPGGTLVLKTYYRTDVRLWLRGKCIGFDFGRRPKWWYFPGSELGGDPTNWWAPNRSGLEALLQSTGWTDVRHVTTWRDRLYFHATRAYDPVPR
jgi:hypothetical protein